MRDLRYGFGIAKLFNDSQVTRVDRGVGVVLKRALRRAVDRGRVGDVLVLSRSRVEGCLARVLQVGGNLSLDVDVVAQTVIVNVRVG